MNFEKIEMAAAELRNEPWVTPTSMSADPAVREYLTVATPTRVHEMTQVIRRLLAERSGLVLALAAERQRADMLLDQGKIASAAVQAEQQRYEALALELAAAKASIPAQTGMAQQGGGELPQDERAAFEAWWKGPANAYGVMWEAWQARAALAQRAASVPDWRGIASGFGASVIQISAEQVRNLGLSGDSAAAFERAVADGDHISCMPVPAASVPAEGSMVIGFPDPEAVFAQFCEREGYPSDGEMDEALRKAFYKGSKLGYPAASVQPFQQRVQPWMMACFGADISADTKERNHRFFEESTELVQAQGMTASEAHQLVDYVYGRPVGDPAQEVGGVMVTLAALCLANGLDMHQAGEIELARIWTKVEAIRAKQAAKPKHSPLPQAVQPDTGRDAALVESVDTLEFCDLITELVAAHGEMCSDKSKASWARLVSHIDAHTMRAVALATHPAPEVASVQPVAVPELLNCPHCAAAPDLVDNGTGSYRVACLVSKGGCGSATRMTFDKGLTAKAEWNRRAAIAQRAPEVASGADAAAGRGN